MITLEADNLSIVRAKKTIVKDLSFKVIKGEVFSLLGGNGAGKTSTLLAFLGFLSPVKGTVKVNGVDVQQNTLTARQSIAYLPESANLYPHLTARENIAYFLSLAKVKHESNDIEAALTQVSLAQDARDQKLSSYSKGMRQKVAIAVAILRQAPILFLDEPTSGLDPVAITEFNGLIKTLSENGTTVFMVTHDIYGACQVSHRIGLLRHGELVDTFESLENEKISIEKVHKAFSFDS